MKKFLLFLALLLFPALCFAKEATFIGRSEYIIAVGTGADAEAIALEDAKRLALEQAGTYLESLTVVENNAVTIDRIKVIARGTAKLVPGSIHKQYSTIDSNTGAQKLILEAQFSIDPDEVAAEIARAKSSNMFDLGAAQEKYDAVIAEDQRLQAELLQTTDEAERETLIEKYRRSRNRFFAMQWYMKGLNEVSTILSNESWLPEKDAKRIIILFDKGIEIDPSYANNHIMHGYLNFYLFRFDDALTDLNKALKLLPSEQTYDISLVKSVKNDMENYIRQSKGAPTE